MGRGLLAGVLLVAACGRYQFEPQPDPSDPPAPAPERLLACGAPARFSIGAALPSLNVAATPAGFAIVGVDAASALRGWTYEWNAETLAPGAEDVPLASDATTTTGIAVVDAEVVVASIYGGATPIGTRLHALDAELSSLAPASSRVGVMVGESPISRGGGGAAADLALISVDATGRVDARRIDAGGADLSPTQIVVDSAEVPSSVRIAAGKDGYVLLWTSAAGSPNEKRLARLDRNLDRVAGPISVSSGIGENTIRGAVAWLPDADRYLVTWFEKTPTGGDDVWFQIFDGALAPATTAIRLDAGGVAPQVGTDGAHFFVAWKDVSVTPRAMAVAVISADGAVTQRAVPSSGGSPLSYAFTERNGQAVLVWSETGGTGPDLWLDPMCPGQDPAP